MRRLSYRTGLPAILIVAFSLVVFGALLKPGTVVMTTDDNIGALLPTKQTLPDAFFHAEWRADPLVGVSAGVIPFIWTAWWMALLPIELFANWIHAISLVSASVVLYAFLRRKTLFLSAGVLGALVFCWLGSNFTLTYAGHVPKFSVLFFAALTLLFLDVMTQKKSLGWAVLAGGSLGLMWMEQQDLALFFGLFLGAFAVFSVWQNRAKPFPSVLRLGVVAALALVMALPILLSSYKHHVADVTDEQQSKQEKWEFCTQWSWPPEESIEFIAPGYTGWRSGEPEGPYWGRMGRSEGWEQTGQGFMNFKLETTYIGVIPIAFALFALFSSRRSLHRAEILFWGGATFFSLLLAFGKFFPLYDLFWRLPVANNIRNPNKFLQVFQLGLAILAAYGLDALLVQGEGLKGEKVKFKSGRDSAIPNPQSPIRNPQSPIRNPQSAMLRTLVGFLFAVSSVFAQQDLSMEVKGFRVPEYDDQGVMTSQLFGDQAQIEGGGEVKITGLRVEFYKEGKTVVTVTSPYCFYNQKTREAHSDAPVAADMDRLTMWGRGFLLTPSNTSVRVFDDSKVIIQDAGKQVMGESTATGATNTETVITSKELFLDYKARKARFEKNVHVHDPKMEMFCDELEIRMGSNNQINWIGASTGVRLLHEGREALAGRAFYDVTTDEVVMQDHPVIVDGKNQLMGETIRFWRGNKRMVCEPGARLVFYSSDQFKTDLFEK